MSEITGKYGYTQTYKMSHLKGIVIKPYPWKDVSRETNTNPPYLNDSNKINDRKSIQFHGFIRITWAKH